MRLCDFITLSDLSIGKSFQTKNAQFGFFVRPQVGPKTQLDQTIPNLSSIQA